MKKTRFLNQSVQKTSARVRETTFSVSRSEQNLIKYTHNRISSKIKYNPLICGFMSLNIHFAARILHADSRVFRFLFITNVYYNNLGMCHCSNVTYKLYCIFTLRI